MIVKWFLTLFVLILAGCGGGGSSDPTSPTKVYTVTGRATQAAPTAQKMKAQRVSPSAENGSAVANASVTLRDPQGQNGPFTGVTGQDGTFEINNVPAGEYDVEIRGNVSAKVAWGLKQGVAVPEQANLGNFPLNIHPLLRSVTIRQTGKADVVVETTSNNLPYQLTEVQAGDVLEVVVAAEDPNSLPLSMSANPGVNVNGFTATYTVTAADVADGGQMILSINNTDGVFGFDGVRDILVRVVMPITGSATGLSEVVVNGQSYEPFRAVTTAPVPADQSFVISAVSSENTSFTWKQGSAVITQLGSSATIPVEAMADVYTVEVGVVSGDKIITVFVPVGTTDQPATINGVAIEPQKAVYNPGDVITLTVDATDPNGGVVEYLFDLVGANAQLPASQWQTSNVLTYTVTGNEATSFTVNVFVRNSDGRVLPTIQADAKVSVPITVGL